MANHKFYRQTDYWPKKLGTKTTHVIAFRYFANGRTRSNDDYLNDGISQYSTLAEAERVINQYRSGTRKGYEPYLLDVDGYYEFLQQFKDGNLQEIPDMNELVPTGATGLKGKLVFAVWNMTLGKGVGAAESLDAAKELAKTLAIKEPSSTFLIMAPVIKASQPVQVDFEDIKG